MSEMIDRVAKAIKDEIARDEEVYTRDDGAHFMIDGYVNIEKVARAVLTAMRVPTDKALKAVSAQEERNNYMGPECLHASEAWPLMIDADLT